VVNEPANVSGRILAVFGQLNRVGESGNKKSTTVLASADLSVTIQMFTIRLNGELRHLTCEPSQKTIKLVETPRSKHAGYHGQGTQERTFTH
jgi:hypothetical protein